VGYITQLHSEVVDGFAPLSSMLQGDVALPILDVIKDATQEAEVLVSHELSLRW